MWEITGEGEWQGEIFASGDAEGRPAHLLPMPSNLVSEPMPPSSI
jgi:hypothetical protein